MIGPSATGPLIDNLNTVAPGPARDILTGAIEDVANSRGAAGLAFVLGLLLALYSAAGYTGAFARASNAIYKVEEGRPIWTLKPARTPRCCFPAGTNRSARRKGRSYRAGMYRRGGRIVARKMA